MGAAACGARARAAVPLCSQSRTLGRAGMLPGRMLRHRRRGAVCSRAERVCRGAGLLPCCEQQSGGAVHFETRTRHLGAHLAAGPREELPGRPRLLVVEGTQGRAGQS